jgi:hypothetical protein
VKLGHPAVALLQFFFDSAPYQAEVELYSREELRKIMPRIYEAHDNADKAIRDPSGYEFPPVLVIERGESLDEFAARATTSPSPSSRRSCWW